MFSMALAALAVAGKRAAVYLALNAVKKIGYGNVLLACLIATLVFMVLIQSYNGFERGGADTATAGGAVQQS